MQLLRLSVCLATLAWICGGASWVAPCAADEAAAQSAEEAGHGDHGDAEHGGEVNPLAVDRDLAVWTLVVFLILLFVLRKFAWGPISEALDRREQNIADHIAAAERQNEEAKQLLGQYEQKLADAANEVRGIIEEARRDAEHTHRDIVAKANAEAQGTRERALRDIETATAQALKELSEQSANLAVELAGKIVATKLDSNEHARLVEEAVDRFTKPSAN